MKQIKFVCFLPMFLCNSLMADSVEYFMRVTCLAEQDYFNLGTLDVNYSGDISEGNYESMAKSGVFPVYKPFTYTCRLKGTEINIFSKPKLGDEMKYPKPGAEVTITIGKKTILNAAWLNTVSFGGPYITSISVNEGSSTQGYMQIRG